MSKGKKIRFTLTVKFLIMFLSVVLIANITIGTVSYKASSKGMTQSVYSHIDAISNDVVNQIAAINEKIFRGVALIEGGARD